jgi:hypothetical protein
VASCRVSVLAHRSLQWAAAFRRPYGKTVRREVLFRPNGGVCRSGGTDRSRRVPHVGAIDPVGTARSGKLGSERRRCPVVFVGRGPLDAGLATGAAADSTLETSFVMDRSDVEFDGLSNNGMELTVWRPLFRIPVWYPRASLQFIPGR